MDTKASQLAREGTAQQRYHFEDLLAKIRQPDRWRELRAWQSELWALFGKGLLTDDHASYLEEIIQARLKPPASPPPATGPKIRAPESQVGSRPRGDGSLARRRQNIAIGLLPDGFLCGRRWGFFAVLSVIAQAYLGRGRCELHVEAIGAKAGYCATTVRAAIAWARDQGWVTIEHRRRPGALRNDANLIRIIDPAWIKWLRARAPTWRAMTKRGAALWHGMVKAGSNFAGPSSTKGISGVALARDKLGSAAPPGPGLGSARGRRAKPAPS